MVDDGCGSGGGGGGGGPWLDVTMVVDMVGWWWTWLDGGGHGWRWVVGWGIEKIRQKRNFEKKNIP